MLLAVVTGASEGIGKAFAFQVVIIFLNYICQLLIQFALKLCVDKSKIQVQYTIVSVYILKPAKSE